jgi:hypothetical protein
MVKKIWKQIDSYGYYCKKKVGHNCQWVFLIAFHFIY